MAKGTKVAGVKKAKTTVASQVKRKVQPKAKTAKMAKSQATPMKKTAGKMMKLAATKLAKKVVSKLEEIVTGPGESAAKSLVGTIVPKLKLAVTGGGEASLADFTGKRIVLYFYPKDSTPGCTLEGYDFKRLKQEFDSEKAVILGVSKDSVKSHESFKTKCGFPFELLADQEEKLCRAFDVIQMKSLYGRRYLGVERSTFVIDEKGKIAREWRKVKVNGHAEEVLDFLRTLS